jgi:hypothetical protein
MQLNASVPNNIKPAAQTNVRLGSGSLFPELLCAVIGFHAAAAAWFISRLFADYGKTARLGKAQRQKSTYKTDFLLLEKHKPDQFTH